MIARSKVDRSRRLRGPVVAALVAALAVVGTVVPQAPARADVGVVVSGRGDGHGQGLSLYGAKGRAEAGQTYQQILAAYYPGTTLGSVSDTSTLRVWVEGDIDGETWVRAEPGMTVRGGSGDAVALPATVGGYAPTLWRVYQSSGALVLEGWIGFMWVEHGVPAITSALAGQTTASIAAPDGTLEVVVGSVIFREYRGEATATLVGTGTSARVRTVITTTMASYLRSVVRAQMSVAWHPQALRAQAVVARSYALHEQASAAPDAWYDTCDTACQPFKGVRDLTSGGVVTTVNEHPNTDAAVAATSGVTVLSGGSVASTQFTVSNGGHSAAGSEPYLVAAPDPYDTYPAWTVDLSETYFTGFYGEIGGFVSMTVLERDGAGPWGGRVTSVRIDGTEGSVTVTGEEFADRMQLRSTLFTVSPYASTAPAPQRDWNGDGGADLIGRAPDGKLFLYRGLPGATWAKRVQIGNGWNTMRLMTQVHGFSGTNKPEIITTNAQGLLYLYPGNGTGGFGTPVRLGQGWSGFDLIVGLEGFHAPGQPSLFARKSTGEGYLYPGNGRGGFGPVIYLGDYFDTYDMILDAADWDRDGFTDVLTRDADSGDLILHRGNGRGWFDGVITVGTGWGGMDEVLGAADWNRDGRYDVMAREESTGNLWLYPGDGAGGFLPRQQVGHGWVGFSLVK